MDDAIVKDQICIRVPKPQLKELRKISKKEGRPVSEIIRDGITHEIQKRKEVWRGL